MFLSLISRADIQPITVDELKAHSVIPHDLDDALLQELLDEALEQVATDTGRTLVDTVWENVMPRFPDVIRLARPPVSEVISIEYVDTAGDLLTLPASAYQVSITAAGADVRPAPGERWPAAQPGNHNAVTVRFRAGYVLMDEDGKPQGELPKRARLAALIWAAHLYENREHMSPVQLYELPSYNSLIATLETGLI